jgi:hypothetical protein
MQYLGGKSRIANDIATIIERVILLKVSYLYSVVAVM